MGKMIFLRWPQGKVKALTLSYDDGRMEDFRLADLMRQNGVKGTFNINSGAFYPDDKIPDRPTHRRMKKAELLEFYEKNRDIAEIAVHTLTHPKLETLTPAEQLYEVVEDRRRIEEMLGTFCRGMAYPYGTYNATTLEALRLSGIAYSRTTKATMAFDLPKNWLELAPTCHHRVPELPELWEKFQNLPVTGYRARPALFYLWGHSYEFDDADNWNVIEEFLQKAGGKSDVYYATNLEIYDYVKAYESLMWTADGKRVYNPTLQDIFFATCTSSIHETHEYCVKSGEVLEV